jgi:hypothetical protein
VEDFYGLDFFFYLCGGGMEGMEGMDRFEIVE